MISEQLAFSVTGGGVARTHGNFDVSVTGKYDGTIKLQG
jgi:hypothetical protein